MSNTLLVHKNRTNILPVSLGMDVSGDTFTSEIRTPSGNLIVAWTVTFDSDGSDGELILTLDNTTVSAVTHNSGVMDIKRVSSGEPLPLFDYPIEVQFVTPVTV